MNNEYDPYKPTINLPGMAINVTAEQVAEGFWNLDAAQMADFFYELDRIAAGRLCMQMAAVVRELSERSASGDYSCLNGFQTMLSHAQDIHDSFAFYRAEDAKREIAEMVHGAKRSINPPAVNTGD